MIEPTCLVALVADFLHHSGGWHTAHEVAAGIDCDLAKARDSLRALERAGDLESREFRQPAAWWPRLPRLPATTDIQWRVTPR